MTKSQKQLYWILGVGGAAVAGGLIYYLAKKKPEEKFTTGGGGGGGTTLPAGPSISAATSSNYAATITQGASAFANRPLPPSLDEFGNYSR
jgi:hypothetical protein